MFSNTFLLSSAKSATSLSVLRPGLIPASLGGNLTYTPSIAWLAGEAGQENRIHCGQQPRSCPRRCEAESHPILHICFLITYSENYFSKLQQASEAADQLL